MQCIWETFERAFDWEVPASHGLLKLKSSATVLLEFVLSASSFTAAISLLLHYSKTFDSSYGASFEDFYVTNSATDSVSCRSVQAEMESYHRRFDHDTELLRGFSEALRLNEKLNDETTSITLTIICGALDATCLNKAVLFSSNDYNVLLFVEALAVHTLDEKQNSTLNGLFFYSYAAYILQ